MIRADIYTDDQVFEFYEFDVTEYFRHAPDSAIVALALADWHGCKEAYDIPAFFCTESRELDSMLTYVKAASSRPRGPRFNCAVSEDDAMRWLKDNRPDAYRKVILAIADRNNCTAFSVNIGLIVNVPRNTAASFPSDEGTSFFARQVFDSLGLSSPDQDRLRKVERMICSISPI